MEHHLYVISDLHLGGHLDGPDKPDCSMCSQKGRARLADFITFVAAQRADNRRVELVINGDFIDFLAERPFSAFTSDDEEARRKLAAAMKGADNVFSVLSSFVKGGGHLTLLIGNHDLELSLPGPRRDLLHRLGSGGLIDFLYDNQGLSIGPILIEHGNRYDGWNAVSHNLLRQLRSSTSRREKDDCFDAPYGSWLVTDVMNKIKDLYTFIDLLKPETEAAIPLLAVFAPQCLDDISEIIDVLDANEAAGKVAYDKQRRPRDPSRIAGEESFDRARRERLLRKGLASFPEPDTSGDDDVATAIASESKIVQDSRHALEFAAQLTEGRPMVSHKISAGNKALGLYHTWRGAKAEIRAEKVEQLRLALLYLMKDQPDFLSTSWEQPKYLTAAGAAADRGYQYVVYGHTHLMRNCLLQGRSKSARYFNTGTWADLLFLPTTLILTDQKRALPVLTELADDLVSNRLDGRRGQIPSYAHLILGDGGKCTGALKVFHTADRQDDVRANDEIRNYHVRH